MRCLPLLQEFVWHKGRPFLSEASLTSERERMAPSAPKAHHYIPKMLLNGFKNANDRIWVRDGSKTYESSPRNVFCIGHLNTNWEFANSPCLSMASGETAG